MCAANWSELYGNQVNQVIFYFVLIFAYKHRKYDMAPLKQFYLINDVEYFLIIRSKQRQMVK